MIKILVHPNHSVGVPKIWGYIRTATEEKIFFGSINKTLTWQTKPFGYGVDTAHKKGRDGYLQACNLSLIPPSLAFDDLRAAFIAGKTPSTDEGLVFINAVLAPLQNSNANTGCLSAATAVKAGTSRIASSQPAEKVAAKPEPKPKQKKPKMAFNVSADSAWDF